MRVVPVFLLAAGLAVLPAACGERKAGPGPGADGESPAGGRADTTPEPESRGALSTRLRERLAAGDLVAAEAALEGLIRAYDGEGELPDGRTLSPEAMSGAVFDVAVERARQAVEGPGPDRAAAERALAVAKRRLPEEPDAVTSRALAERWVNLRALGDLTTPLAAHDGPRVVAVADDYDLAEMLFVRALRRWSAEGGPDGLRVAVVPLLTGWVRVGIRRTKAKDRAEERRSVAARLTDTGVALEPEPADAGAAAADFGLPERTSAVLVFDRAGHLVGRLSGRNLDPGGARRGGPEGDVPLRGRRGDALGRQNLRTSAACTPKSVVDCWSSRFSVTASSNWRRRDRSTFVPRFR